MQFRQELQVKEIPNWGGYLRGKWKESFASHLSANQKRAIYLHQYLWHLFSYEERNYIDGEEAINAFLKQKKGKCTIFFQHVDDAYVIEHAASLGLTDLVTNDQDLYVMDWNGKWTFIITHEREFGPYYCKN